MSRRRPLRPAFCALVALLFYCEHEVTDIVEDRLGNRAIMVWWVDSGRAQVFRDGIMVECRWSRPQPAEQMRLVDSDGRDISSPGRPGSRSCRWTTRSPCSRRGFTAKAQRR